MLRRIGPETWVEPIGRNGTYRWDEKHGWLQLVDGQRHLIEDGDRVRFADVQVQVTYADRHLN